MNQNTDPIHVLFADDQVQERNEDGDSLLTVFQEEFSEFHFIPQSQLTKRDVLQSLQQHPKITVVILDLLNSDGERVGVDILKAIPKDRVQVIVYSQITDSPELVNECDAAGAYDYFGKGKFLPESIRLKIESAHQRATEYRTYWNERELEDVPSKYGIDGRSPAIRHVKSLIDRVAELDANVLIEGETGVGKELVARGIHQQSGRRHFFAQNVAATHENSLQSELFGHEKGAFTGAIKKRDGLFLHAGRSGGTVFLDEIGDAPERVQIALLRVFQERTVKPLGSDTEIPVGNFRLICATNRNLETMMADETFRQDLYYRMARVVIEVPPLRERIEDIGILAKQFIAKYRKRYEGRLSIPEEMPIDPSDMEQMRNYRWPGNVRELEAVIERGLILDELHDGIFRLAPPDREKMDKTAKPVAVPTDTGGPAIPLIQDGDFISIEMIKDQAIELALKHTNGNKSQAAAYLGISPLTIDRRQKSLNPRPVESQ